MLFCCQRVLLYSSKGCCSMINFSRWKNALITHFACNKTLLVTTYRKLYASLTWEVPEVPRISPTDPPPPPPKSPPPRCGSSTRLSSDFASTRSSGTGIVTPKLVASVVPREEKHPSLRWMMMMMMMPSSSSPLSLSL